MFLTLLLATLLTALAVSALVAWLFARPVDGILARIVAEDIAFAWTRYVKFAILVVGVSGGVRVHQLELFLRPADEHFVPPELTWERWVLEIYRTVMEALQSIAWMLLVFFVFTLLAYVIVRVFGSRKSAG